MPGWDFNNDGRDDILWHNNADNSYFDWLGTISGGFLGPASFDNWALGQITAVGDFNGDGRDDILRYASNGSTGTVALGPTAPGGTFDFMSYGFTVADVPTDWQIVGAGDFNGDHIDDILWKNQQDGRVSNWLGNANYASSPHGFTINDTNALTGSLAQWTTRGIGDFNADGRDDLVVYNSGTWAVVSAGQNGSFQLQSPFATAPLDWQVLGVGDFNGDNHGDLLWRNSQTGAISNWLYTGGQGGQTFTINDVHAFNNVPLDWQIVQIGDFNGDGRDDLLWRNDTIGAISDWLATASGGWIINDTNAFTVVSHNWDVQPHMLGLTSPWDY